MNIMAKKKRPSIIKPAKPTLTEAINKEDELILKLHALPEAEIFNFMSNLRGGTFFDMGMYVSIPVARAYKSTIRIYRVIEMTSIVSGIKYENTATTIDFRNKTGTTPKETWYDHAPGYPNKVGIKKSDATKKYVLWDIKANSGTNVKYYVADIATGDIAAVTKQDVLSSDYLTETEKNKLRPTKVTGYDLKTNELVTNETKWRTAAFEHIFWLKQDGKSTAEVGTRFEEDLNLFEDMDDIFIDGHAHATADLDSILANGFGTDESVIEEDPFFTDFPE